MCLWGWGGWRTQFNLIHNNNDQEQGLKKEREREEKGFKEVAITEQLGRGQASKGNRQATRREAGQIRAPVVSRRPRLFQNRGMVSRVAEMGLSGLRAEKLTNGCDSVVTADPDDHSP